MKVSWPEPSKVKPPVPPTTPAKVCVPLSVSVRVLAPRATVVVDVPLTRLLTVVPALRPEMLRAAVPLRVTPLLEAREPEPLSASVPATMLVEPVKVLTPDRVTVLAVVLLRLPVPPRTALTVPDCRPKVAVVSSVPFWIVPLVRVTPPLETWVVVPRSTVPPEPTVRLLPVRPRVPAPVMSSTPSTVVEPE